MKALRGFHFLIINDRNGQRAHKSLRRTKYSKGRYFIMTNMFLDNYTVEQIIEYGRNMKDKTAGRKWTERVLKEKAARVAELEKIAVQEKMQEKYKKFEATESKADRIQRSDEQKERTAKIYANKHDLDLDTLLSIQTKLYRDEVAQTEKDIDNSLEEELDFGFEMIR